MAGKVDNASPGLEKAWEKFAHVTCVIAVIASVSAKILMCVLPAGPLHCSGSTWLEVLSRVFPS